jgi:hypothetical membrane protein
MVRDWRSARGTAGSGWTIGAIGGVAGPAAFIAAWSVLGATRPGYSPIADPISRLAAIDSPTRVAMTVGFLAFGAGVALYAAELRTALSGSSAFAAVTAATASVGIAATPIGSSLGGAPHAVCATIAYTALAAIPILGARSLARRGLRRASTVSVAVGVASGLSLAASTLTSPWAGLLQRLGLTLGDIWIIGTAWHLLPRRDR